MCVAMNQSTCSVVCYYFVFVIRGRRTEKIPWMNIFDSKYEYGDTLFVPARKDQDGKLFKYSLVKKPLKWDASPRLAIDECICLIYLLFSDKSTSSNFLIVPGEEDALL